MKIDYAIMSSDKNPFYLDFWPLTSKMWKRLGVTPVLSIIGDKNTSFYNDEYGIVKEFKKLKNIPIQVQATLLRYYTTKYFKEDYCIISDIDIIPISKEYFFKQSVKQNRNSFIVFCSDMYLPKKRYASCYNLAKGKIFEEALKIDKNFKDFANKITSKYGGWGNDEKFLYTRLNKWSGNSIFLKRGLEKNFKNRLDRGYWRYKPEDVIKEKFYDIHLIRPLKKYKKQINYLIKLIENPKKNRNYLEDKTQEIRRYIYKIINPEKTNRLKGKIGFFLKENYPKIFFSLKSILK